MSAYLLFYKSCEEFIRGCTLPEHHDGFLPVVEAFCADPCEVTARQVYSAYLRVFRIPGMDELFEAMQRFEITSAKLIPSHRDHYLHTVNVFLLGLTMYVRNHTIRERASVALDYPDRYDSADVEFLYRWGLASLFHDVGYPLEIAYKTIREFISLLAEPDLLCNSGEIVCGNGRRSPTRQPTAVLQFPRLEDLLYINNLPPRSDFESTYAAKYPFFRRRMGNNMISLIAGNLSGLQFADRAVLCRRIKIMIKQSLQDGLVDHGIYSSIIVLKWINDAFCKASWNPAYYYYPVVDAATAIFLHNSYDYVFMQTPFNCPALRITDHLLGFLLILCDRLQEFDRPSYGYTGGFIMPSRGLEIDDSRLALYLGVPTGLGANLVDLQIQEARNSIHHAIDIKPVFLDFILDVGV